MITRSEILSFRFVIAENIINNPPFTINRHLEFYLFEKITSKRVFVSIGNNTRSCMRYVCMYIYLILFGNCSGI